MHLIAEKLAAMERILYKKFILYKHYSLFEVRLIKQ